MRTSPTSDVATFSPFHLRTKTTAGIKVGVKQPQSRPSKGGENSPEGVADSVLEVDKVLVVDAQQIAGVEVQIAFFQDVTKPLLLSLLPVSGVADKRRPLCHLSHQESRLAWWERACRRSVLVWNPGGRAAPANRHHETERFTERKQRSWRPLPPGKRAHLWLPRRTDPPSSGRVPPSQCQT